MAIHCYGRAVSRRLRLGVVALTALAVGAFVVNGVIAENPERKELDRQIAMTDAELVQRKAIVRDLDRYRAFVASLRTKADESNLRFAQDLEHIESAIAGRGVTLQIKSRAVSGMYEKVFFQLSGEGEEALRNAFGAITSSGYLLQLTAMDVSPEREFSIELMGFSFVAPPSPAAPSAPPRAWYSGVNDERWRLLEAKQAELAALKVQVADVEPYFALRKELELRLDVLEQLAAGLVRMKTLAEKLATGLTEMKLRSGHVSGELAKDVTEADVRAMVTPDLKLTKITVKDRHLELDVEPRN